jgi:hypothetical protein
MGNSPSCIKNDGNLPQTNVKTVMAVEADLNAIINTASNNGFFIRFRENKRTSQNHIILRTNQYKNIRK